MLHEEQFANLTPLHRAAQKQPQELSRHKEVMQKDRKEVTSEAFHKVPFCLQISN